MLSIEGKKHLVQRGCGTAAHALERSGVAKSSIKSIGLARHLAGALVFALLAGSAQADEGAELAFKYHCITCHGVTGVANSKRYPNLARQNVAYLEGRLKYFRAQEEPGNQMNAQAAPLSDAEITALAIYFNGES